MIVQVYVAGVGSMLSPSSIARTWNVCVPMVRLEKPIGLRHSTASQSPPSIRHSYSISAMSVLSSVAVKPKTALVAARRRGRRAGEDGLGRDDVLPGR